MATTKKVLTPKSVSKTKNVSPKKPSRTSVSAKKSAKHAPSKSPSPLVHVSDEQCFWVRDGQILQNLDELKNALFHMDDALYQYHVTEDKSDFANWVEFVLGDEKCAHDLRGARTPKDAQSVVVRYFRLYKV